MGPLPPGSPIFPPVDFIFTVAVPGHPGWIYAQGTGLGDLYLSKDWGSTWTKQPSPITPSCSCPTVLMDLRFDPDFPSTLWAADGGGMLYLSQDAGATWNVVTPPSYVSPELPLVPPLAVLGRSCNGGSLLAVDNDNSVIATHDSGLSWLPEHLTGVVNLAVGPGCAVYAVKNPGCKRFRCQALSAGNSALVDIPGWLGPGYTSRNRTGPSGQRLCGWLDGFSGFYGDVSAHRTARNLECVRSRIQCGRQSNLLCRNRWRVSRHRYRVRSRQQWRGASGGMDDFRRISHNAECFCDGARRE